MPSFLALIREKADRAHELYILDRQIEVMKLRHSYQLEEIKMFEDVAEIRALYKYPSPVGVPWVDALSGSVRPVLTYGFFVLYWIVKLSQIFHVLPHVYQDMSVSILAYIWHEEDQALFAAVMSFWFGQRALRRS